MKENYRATLIGCALGDSLGMAVEGWKREQIQKYVGRVTRLIKPVEVLDGQGIPVKKDEFGPIKSWTIDLEKGEYTDDTILTLAIAESIAEKKQLDFYDISKKQTSAYLQCIKPDGTAKGGFGGTTQDAFRKIIAGKDPLDAGCWPGLGAGPAMKMSPVGIYMAETGQYGWGLQMARLIGKSTHLDERAVASGILQAHAIYTLLNNSDRKSFVNSLEKTCREVEISNPKEATLQEKGNLLHKISWIKNNRDATPEEAFHSLNNSSLSMDCHPFALFMFQKYWNKPIEGLIETINYGGDCDTTGAIYGALAGAKNGMIFPKEILADLKNKEKIIAIADKLSEINGGNS